MQVVYERCCGLDVHKKVITACAIVPAVDGKPDKQIRTFGTMTAALLDLQAWLADLGVTHVAMESTGVYWKPVYNILEGTFTLLVVNAQHIKAVPGHKTDLKDCEWIADLLRHGLVRGSFIPDKAHRELRELTRYRVALLRERTSETNRLHKTLEGANIKLAAVVTDIRGLSARQMLEAMVEGETDTAALAHMAKGKLRAKIPQLEQALCGSFGAHQRFMVAIHLAHIDHLDETIGLVSAEITARLSTHADGPAVSTPLVEPAETASQGPDQRAAQLTSTVQSPFERVLANLRTIPGVGQRIAEVLLAEIGIDMSRFPTAGHLAAWAGMAPGHWESAGKRQSGATRKGDPWLRCALVEAAHGVGHSKDNYLSAQYRHLVSKRGKKKAAVAVGHSILVIAYHLIKKGTTYVDLGPNYFDERSRDVVERRLVRRLERLGYNVDLRPIAAAS
ncbi:MAG: IS110 family transposase [Chloroflexi bacterium]|nr:IS110 family transposase [Chloroflexota bacterium]